MTVGGGDGDGCGRDCIFWSAFEMKSMVECGLRIGYME